MKVGLGWLDGSAATSDPESVIEVIGSRLGRPFEMTPVGYYARRVGFDSGRAGVSWLGRAHAVGTTRAEVTQTVLDGLGLDGGVGLLRELTATTYTPSRLDEYVDDHERRMTPERVRAAVLGGQAVTHAHRGRFIHDDESGRETYYLGRPKSDRMVRCYDRPDGETRYELQSRRDAASHAATLLLASDAPMAALTSNLISFADYRDDRSRDRAGRRTPRLDWWAAVVDELERAVPAPAKPRPSLAELERYFRDHWGKRLAELYLAYGGDWLNEVLQDGTRRIESENADTEDVA